MSVCETHCIQDGLLSAVISADGAELHSVRSAGGRELLWQAGPQWPRHAPVLFPIVGRLVNDALVNQGKSYRMPQHGFARDRRFRFTERSTASCCLLLEDDAQSREIYPFAFRLEIQYRIEAGTLTVRYTVSNPSGTVLPASIGAHPAFVWPLDPDIAPEAHEIVFAEAETAAIRRVAGGLLQPELEPSPVHGRHLHLDTNLFTRDAVIFEAPASKSLRYGVPGGSALQISWQGFEQLGIWSKPGAAFVCIEPWLGLASPQDFEGEFSSKPHVMLIPPGGSRTATWSVSASGIA